MIKVAWVSSFDTKCGIAEYSQYLVTALRKRSDIEVQVFGSKNYGNYKVEEGPIHYTPTFAVPLWNGGVDDSFDFEVILGWKPDIVHIQYEVVLYNQKRFNEFLDAYDGPVAITYHDNCLLPDFPYDRFQLQYSHRDGVGIGEGYLLPMGVENRTPVVKTFGLGRSRLDIIQRACEVNGYDLEHSFGESKWLPAEDLYRWLRDSDAIVLYYDDAPMAGVSIAARVAISTRRPVIVNDVTWFKDLADPQVALGIPNLYVVANESQLIDTLDKVVYNSYITESSWDEVALTLVNDYAEVLDAWT